MAKDSHKHANTKAQRLPRTIERVLDMNVVHYVVIMFMFLGLFAPFMHQVAFNPEHFPYWSALWSLTARHPIASHRDTN
eukprot:4458048-Amphidinium_carterae.1